MKFIKPSYEILTNINRDEFLKAIEKAARTCYKSEEKITNKSSSKFVKMLVERNHLAMIEHAPAISVKFIANRGFSHEIVRHRIASFAQESTRYCNYSLDKFKNSISFCMPKYLENSNMELEYVAACGKAENEYFKLIKDGASPQIARDVLPIGVKTEIIVTANLREWICIFELRTSPSAHPIMHELIAPLENELKSILPEIFKAKEN